MDRCNEPWSIRGFRQQPLQAWLDHYRWEHNHVRPHEALGMKTPATVWRPSPKRYDPHPQRWEYPSGAYLRKVDSSGKVKLKGRNWNINQALAGEWVQLVPTGECWMVFYCTTLIREINPGTQRSTIVERWIPTSR